MENLYDILQVDSAADDKVIKKAYVKMLRKYPPEKAPEEFKKIREAYERLIDPVSRAEYDAFSQYKDQIDEHERLGEQAIASQDYQTAIKEFKKILIIEPSLTFAKNKLGLALAYNKQYDSALVQFNELIKLNPNNAIYYSNLAYVYKEKLEYVKAEEPLLKAYELNPIDDDIILALVDVYINLSEYDKATAFLRYCIDRDKTEDFQDFIYYFQIVRVYIFAQDNYSIEKTFDEIERIVPNDKESREYVVWKFGEMANELFKAKLYELSEKISERALEIDNSNDALRSLYNSAKELNQAFKLYNLLSKDEKVIPPLKGPILFYLYSDQYKEDELKENYDKNIGAMQSYIDYQPLDVLNSIIILKKEYTLLYNYRREFYDKINNITLETIKHNEQRSNYSNSGTSSSKTHKRGFGTILIFAIIGAIIIPGVGFFIGGFIGYLITKK